jgi:hypothetical protein
MFLFNIYQLLFEGFILTNSVVEFARHQFKSTVVLSKFGFELFVLL